MKRVQSLVEVFQDYDCYEPAFAFGEDGMEEEKDSRVMQVCSNPRRVVVSLEGVCRVLPQPVQVAETIRWKMVRAVSRVSTSSRSDVVRGDPSRAQISSSAMQYYEKWADMDKEVAAAGENPKRLSTEMRARIHEKAKELVENVALPMRVRSVTVLSFGEIPANWSNYQCDKYIWPIGYKCGSRRRVRRRSLKSYFSYIEPSQHTEYTNEILSGGPRVGVSPSPHSQGPVFRVTAADDPTHSFTASTPTGCWSSILQKVRVERSKMGLGKTGTAVSGPEFFGYAMPEIAACIEGLAGAETCKTYVCRCLRMETNRKGKKARRTSGVSFVEEPTEERPSKRRAAERASQRWQQINDEESSASFSEEDDGDMEMEMEEDDDSRASRSRRSKKRSVPSTAHEDEAQSKKDDLYTLPVEGEERQITTEQLL